MMRRGMETIRKFADWAGPIVYVAMFALAAWILVEADFDVSLNCSSAELSTGDAVAAVLHRGRARWSPTSAR